MKQEIKFLRFFCKILGLYIATMPYSTCWAEDEIGACGNSDYCDNGKIILCPEGQYVASCGNYQIGTNWLKSIKNGNESVYDDKDEYNMKNLRHLFSENEVKGNIVYNKKSGETYTQTTIDASELEKQNYDLLKLFCGSPDEHLESRICKSCPEGSYVEASLVNYNLWYEEITDGKINKKRIQWQIHTIADCYVENKFKDDTGFFYFGTLENDESSDTSSACYYNKTTKGSTLPGAEETTTGDDSENTDTPENP